MAAGLKAVGSTAAETALTEEHQVKESHMAKDAHTVAVTTRDVLTEMAEREDSTVREEAREGHTETKKEAGEDAAAFIKEKEEEYTKLFANPYNAAKYGYIDDVIEPRNTRFRIIRALEQLATKSIANPAKKHGNIPL